MAVDGTPRSVADATRFTANTPHAHAKARSAAATTTTTTATASPPQSSSAPSPSSSSSAARPPTGARSAPPRRPSPLGPSAARPESLEDKVRRLRAAHLAARNHDVSKMDKIISSSRRYMDAAHRYTVMGLIGFSGLALLVTVYATVDMMMYNRKRRSEFFALQQELQTDSLEAARLAYMTGKATDDQITMVEDATAKAKQAGIPLPSLLDKYSQRAGGHAPSTAETSVWPGEAMQESSLRGADDVAAPPKKSFKEWIFGGLKKEDTAAGATELSFNREEAAASGRTGAAINALAEQADAIKGKATSALDAERENQRKGGSLDQVGLNANAGQKKTGWFW
ncbi:hypothetical protein JX266_007603 [Neoarthrinium moseri]|nr:hypothetical protein JX266_007603 [Neoarthrinium moseri]